MRKLRLLFATFLVALSCLAHSANVTYKILHLTDPKKGASLEITLVSGDTTFTNPSDPRKAKGTGKVHVDAGLYHFKIPFDYSVNPLKIDPATNQVVGGAIRLTSDIDVKGIVSSGCDLKIPKDTFINIYPTGVGGVYVEFVPKSPDKISLELPIKISSGAAKSKAKATISALKIEGDGSFDITGDLSFNAASGDSIPLGPVALTKCVLKYNWKRETGKKGEFSVTVTSAEANIAVDGSDTPIKVTIENAKIDNDGALTFSNATYAAPPTNAPSIQFLSPLDFEFTPKTVTASMVKNVLTTFTAKGDLKLPQRFSATKAGSPQRVVFKDTDFKYEDIDPSDPSKGRELMVTVPALTQDTYIYWDGFSVKLDKAKAGTNSFVLDLSSKKNPKQLKLASGKVLPDDWKGLFIDSATIDLPDNLKKQNQIPSIGVANCYIDGEGFSGEVSVADPNGIAGLRVPYGSLDDSSVTKIEARFYQNKISGFGAEGVLDIDEIDAKLNVGFTVTSTGAVSILVDTSQPVSLGGSSDITVKFERGTVWLNGNGKHEISLSGSLHVSDSPSAALLKPVAGASLSIDGLAFDEKMNLSVDGVTLDLPVPYTRKVGPVTLSLSQVGFSRLYKQLPNGGQDPYLEFLFSGDVAVENLPISGGIGFDGLKISKHGADLGGVDCGVDIAGIGYFYVSMSNVSYQLKDSNEVVKEEIPMYRGTGGFQLTALGSSGLGGTISFSCWRDGWFGEVSFPLTPAVKLGNTGLEIRAGRIGLGHNVESSTGKFMGIPGTGGDYKLVPRNPYNDAPNAPPDWKKWIFVAGIRFADLKGDGVWGDLVLTAAWGNGVVIDISGKAAFMTAYDPSPTAFSSPKDRLLTLTLNYDSNLQRFLLTATLEGNFPDKAAVDAKTGIYVKGNVRLLISQNLWELRLGEDVDLTTTPPTFTNPLTAQFWITESALSTGQAALVLNASFANGEVQSIQGKAGVRIKTSLILQTAWKWRKQWEVNAVAALDAYAGGSVRFSRPSGGGLSLEYLYGTLGINLRLTFNVQRDGEYLFGQDVNISGNLEVWYGRNNSPKWGGTYSVGFRVKVLGVNLDLNASGGFGGGPRPF